MFGSFFCVKCNWEVRLGFSKNLISVKTKNLHTGQAGVDIPIAAARGSQFYVEAFLRLDGIKLIRIYAAILISFDIVFWKVLFA